MRTNRLRAVVLLLVFPVSFCGSVVPKADIETIRHMSEGVAKSILVLEKLRGCPLNR
jgi:hypothetical protein